MVLTGNLDTKEYGEQSIMFVNQGFVTGSKYNNDLIYTDNEYNDYDIMKIFSTDIAKHQINAHTLKFIHQICIWERSEVKKVTMQEITDKFGVRLKTLRIKK